MLSREDEPQFNILEVLGHYTCISVLAEDITMVGPQRVGVYMKTSDLISSQIATRRQGQVFLMLTFSELTEVLSFSELIVS